MENDLKEGWMVQAACKDKDPDLFFPGEHEQRLTKAAREVCELCPVSVDCLEYAVKNNIKYGMWGGATEKQRRKVRRERTGSPETNRFL